jgi:hypothetical protein
MAPLDVELDQPIEDILRAIKEGALDGAQRQERTSADAIGPFSALLVRLSRDADRTTRTVRRLTWAIVALTVTLLVLTGVLVWLTWVLVEEDSPEDGDEPATQTTAFYDQTTQPVDATQALMGKQIGRGWSRS